MDTRIIILSGPVASGKSALARKLSETFGMRLLKTRDWIISALGNGGQLGRVNLQLEGERLDQETDGTWVLKELDQDMRRGPGEIAVVVDSVRIKKQINAIRKAYGVMVTHVHMTAPLKVLTERYNSREIESEGVVGRTYDCVRANKTESSVETLKEVADVVIDSNRCTEEDVLTRVACRLGLFGGATTGFVDVIVGGQYGSEGKGQIAAFLAREYDLLVRVGGPNAGHKVFESPNPYTHHQLPSGTRRNENAKLLIGPGAVLNVCRLLEEIGQCNVEVNRLAIDPSAMVISERDIEKEASLVYGIGSTGQGVGAALSRRIFERKLETKLARDVLELKPYMQRATDVLQEILAANGRVCLEGTQGTALSLYHGNYPYVTSRDTTVSGCLADAGIPPSKVRRVVMVCRTYPIRVQNPVGGTSGPISQEISLDIIAKRSGLELTELKRTERTSTTCRERRIGEFDWHLLRKASLLNRPTDIALTFTDYLAASNSLAKRFEQLNAGTINFIEEIERVSEARVSLIGTGFNLRSIIDRRSW